MTMGGPWVARTWPKCKKCGKHRNNHKATTLNCPTGPRTRIGYTSFDMTQVYSPVKKPSRMFNTPPTKEWYAAVDKIDDTGADVPVGVGQKVDE